MSKTPTPAAPMRPLMTMRDVCQTVRLSRAGLYGLIDNGRFPKPFKIGGRVCWKPETIENFVEQQFAAANA